LLGILHLVWMAIAVRFLTFHRVVSVE
jgi:hypothetical protein